MHYILFKTLLLGICVLTNFYIINKAVLYILVAYF